MHQLCYVTFIRTEQNSSGIRSVNLYFGNIVYLGEGKFYDSVVCIRTDVDQSLRNSVILEELYNGLGAVQDTILRPDSIIYQDFSSPQWLSPVDELILRLLYHPDLQCGMTQAQCAECIRLLYR